LKTMSLSSLKILKKSPITEYSDITMGIVVIYHWFSSTTIESIFTDFKPV
jgi:hypothetical protein